MDVQIVVLLREAEKGAKSSADFCREAGVAEMNFYRWRQKFGGSTVSDVRRHIKHLHDFGFEVVIAPVA